MNTNNNLEINDKISVADYLNNKDLLMVSYIPFDTKMQIVNHVVLGTINSIGGLNTTLLRRISTEMFIESITNIDMKITDENGLSGFDQLCFHNKLDELKLLIGREYLEFDKILSERVDDYIRTETNPSVTINAIYDQIKVYFGSALDYISELIKNADVEKLSDNIMKLMPNNNLGGDTE